MVESCTTLFLKVKLREFYTISILQDNTSKISFSEKVVGCAHTIHTTISPGSMSCQANDHCISKGSQLAKTICDFLPF